MSSLHAVANCDADGPATVATGDRAHRGARDAHTQCNGHIHTYTLHTPHPLPAPRHASTPHATSRRAARLADPSGARGPAPRLRADRLRARRRRSWRRGRRSSGAAPTRRRPPPAACPHQAGARARLSCTPCQAVSGHWALDAQGIWALCEPWARCEPWALCEPWVRAVIGRRGEACGLAAAATLGILGRDRVDCRRARRERRSFSRAQRRSDGGSKPRGQG